MRGEESKGDGSFLFVVLVTGNYPIQLIFGKELEDILVVLEEH